jgi:hypothetical protein
MTSSKSPFGSKVLFFVSNTAYMLGNAELETDVRG